MSFENKKAEIMIQKLEIKIVIFDLSIPKTRQGCGEWVGGSESGWRGSRWVGIRSQWCRLV